MSATRKPDSPRLDTEAGTAEDGAPALSAGKRRAFWIATLLVPVVFFALLEGGLRLFGYGGSYPLFVPVENAPGVMMPSRDVARRYFANNNPPTPNADFFPADKPDGTFRVVVMGGSSAAGYPFYRNASLSQVLDTRLGLAYPDREIEVINTAMAAVNSFTLLDFVDEILEIEPDAVLIYAGHNEYYGALGAASTESVGGSAWLVRTYLALRDLRTVQLMRGALASVQRAASEREAGERPSNTLMARMVGEQAVPLGSDVFERGADQFRGNLSRILAAYERADVPVYVGTLASNERDQRPFVTVHQEGVDAEAWGRDLRTAITEVENGAGPEPLRAVAEADPEAADAPFVLGHALLSQGDRDGAQAAFQRARDLDALRFRAPSAFDDIIREEAAAHGAVVVETEAALRGLAPDGLIGSVAMLEHLHPTLLGYATLADAFFDALVASGQIGPVPQPTPPGRLVSLVTPMDSIAGYIRLDQLTASWPFRPDERRPFRLDTTRTPAFVAERARATLAGEPWLQQADAVARFYEASGDLAQALRTRRAIVQQFPFLAEPYVHLANLELRRARSSNRPDPLAYVAGLYGQALERDSSNAAAHGMLGALRLQTGDPQTAVYHLERSVRAAPDGTQPLYNLAGAYAMMGRWDEAADAAARLQQLAPDDPRYARLAEGIRLRRL